MEKLSIAGKSPLTDKACDVALDRYGSLGDLFNDLYLQLILTAEYRLEVYATVL